MVSEERAWFWKRSAESLQDWKLVPSSGFQKMCYYDGKSWSTWCREGRSRFVLLLRYPPKVKRHNIPPSLTMSVDQTPSKFIPGSKAMQAKIGSTTVPIAGSTETKTIILTFLIALNGAFVTIKAIYEGKTTGCLPRVKLPESLCLSINQKHWGNEKEILKRNEDVIVPYATKERQKLSDPNQPTLLIMNVLKWHMTNPVLKKLEEHSILLTRVPGNMIHLFRPLDLTVNGCFKQNTDLQSHFRYANYTFFIRRRTNFE